MAPNPDNQRNRVETRIMSWSGGVDVVRQVVTAAGEVVEVLSRTTFEGRAKAERERRMMELTDAGLDPADFMEDE